MFLGPAEGSTLGFNLFASFPLSPFLVAFSPYFEERFPHGTCVALKNATITGKDATGTIIQKNRVVLMDTE